MHQVDLAVFRDLDSRLSEREVCPVHWNCELGSFVCSCIFCIIVYVLYTFVDDFLLCTKVAAVREWIESDKAVHTMRDHPHVRKLSLQRNYFFYLFMSIAHTDQKLGTGERWGEECGAIYHLIICEDLKKSLVS